MPKQIVFQDKDNEMKFYVNSKNQLYVEIARQNSGDDPIGWASIALEKSDVKEMIKALKEAEKQLE